METLNYIDPTQPCFRDCNVLITGAGRGIGEYLAAQFSTRGANVLLNDIVEARIHSVADKLRAQGFHPTTLPADICDLSQVEKMFEKIHHLCGGLDIFINSAGFAKRLPLLEVTEEYWDQILAVNLKGPFFCLQSAARQMIDRGWGRMILIGSIGGHAAQKNLTAYGAAKAAIALLAKSAAVELAPYNITVNVVAPGAVSGPWNDQFFQDPEYFARWVKTVPAGRMAANEDVSRAVLFFASKGAGYITGQTLFIDGGKLAYVPSADAYERVVANPREVEEA